ncbi:MAG: hypothetical protein VX498_15710 [Myxococcota bacterium]|nr:hypothetical protein [Myxococcota bacterium]
MTLSFFPSSLPTFVLLLATGSLLLLTGCQQQAFQPILGDAPGDDYFPPGDDDDTLPPADDDDSQPPADDDDSQPPADDDDSQPEPSTGLSFISPNNSETLSYEVFTVVEAFGVSEGTVRWYLGGHHLGNSNLNPSTLRAQYNLDTIPYPDGSYTLRAVLQETGDDAQRNVFLENTDLLVYELPPIIYDPGAFNPATVSIDVPQQAISLQLQIEADPAADIDYLWSAINSPNGQWAINGEDTIYEILASLAEPWAGGIPNHPNNSWQTGTYTAYPYVEGPDAPGLELGPTALIKRSFGEPEAGLIDFDFYFVPGIGLTASTAPNHPHFIAFIDALDSILAGADLGTGELRYFNTYGSSYNDIYGEEEIQDLLSEGNINSDRRLNVFFVDELELPGFPLYGIASHIPGPALASGSAQSGVIMVSEFINQGDAWSGAILAGHEIGHYLGLYHTSEDGGTYHDPLDDTPVSCNANTCWDTNLMDPFGLALYSLTEDQRYVLMRHPLVQLVEEEELGARSILPTPPSDWSPHPSLASLSCGVSPGG